MENESNETKELKPISKMDAVRAYVQMNKKSILKKAAVVLGAAAGIALIVVLNNQQTDEVVDVVATDVLPESVPADAAVVETIEPAPVA